MTLEDRVAALVQHYGSLHRILICPPDKTEAILTLLEKHHVAHLWTVRPSSLCPDDKLFLIDGTALQTAITNGYRNGPGIITYLPRE